MRNLLLPIAMALMVAALWYCLWVQPRTEFLFEVMDCMGADASKQAYSECANEVSERYE
jgi:cytochrome b